MEEVERVGGWIKNPEKMFNEILGEKWKKWGREKMIMELGRVSKGMPHRITVAEKWEK